MAVLLRVPEVAAGATEAILSEWLVSEGAAFHVGEPIAVLETEKAQVEIEADTDAVILRALVTAGSQVEVGAPMALIGEDADRDADLDAVLAELGVESLTSKPAAPLREVAEPDVAQPAAAVEEAAVGRQFASPIARKLLREAGIEAEGLVGSGPNGRIVRRDVEAAVSRAQDRPARGPVPAPDEASGSTPAPVRSQATEFVDEPHSRLRRAVATRLTESKQSVPHFYLKRTARIDDLLALRGQVNAQSPVRISLNDFVIRAVGVAHSAVPEANVIWTADAIRRFAGVDVAVAIASARGLVTPVLRGVEKSSLGSISRAIKVFVDQADSGKLQQKDLEGGSITVTNLGMYGVEEFQAIINPPHSAILAVGAGRPAPTVVDDQVVVTNMMTLVLSVDHRAIDGALAARWMNALVEALESPLRLLV